MKTLADRINRYLNSNVIIVGEGFGLLMEAGAYLAGLESKSARYGTFNTTTTYPLAPGSSVGVIDLERGEEYHTSNLKTAERLAVLLNRGTDCRFNCRAKRKADYEQGVRAGKLMAGVKPLQFGE